MPEDDQQLTITLIYAGQLAGEAGTPEEEVEAVVGTPLTDLLRGTATRHGGKFEHLLFDEEAALRRALVVSVDDSQVMNPSSFTLEKNHDVFLMTPIAGG